MHRSAQRFQEVKAWSQARLDQPRGLRNTLRSGFPLTEALQIERTLPSPSLKESRARHHPKIEIVLSDNFPLVKS
jgi:hypothetical protein